MGQQANKSCFTETGCANHEILCSESAYCNEEIIRVRPEFEAKCALPCHPNETSADLGGKIILEQISFEAAPSHRERVRERRPIQHRKDGSSYDGQWFRSARDGHGTQQLPGGARYEGQWLDDRYHGVGTYTNSDGSTYNGEWLGDRQHGKGVENWADGSKFVGQYEDGFKTGTGLFFWPDGTKYDGQMFKNELSGEGICTRTDGRKYKGQWAENKMEGRGIFTWKDGKMYEGEYKNDLKHGSGVFVYADGRRYDGQWEFGKMHGVGLWYEKEQDGQGLGRKGKWTRGKFQGFLTSSDEQISHISTTCSTGTFGRSSVLSDMTCETSEKVSAPSLDAKHKWGGKKVSSLFTKDIEQLNSLFDDSEKDSDCAKGA
jgi:hypothetical protein